MIEIRPIRAPEGERFLHLLCDVFELDFYRAEGIFFTEPMFDIDRKWALFENGEMVSILTTVPLEFGWGRAFGVAGVATLPRRRGEGLAGRLLDRVFDESAKSGEGSALLFAKQPGVYAVHGFAELDRVTRGTIVGTAEERNPKLLDNDEVRQRYDQWAKEDDSRLHRNEKRWQYWKWNLRMCSALPSGYMCLEGNTLREAIVKEPQKHWPVGPYTEWTGLSTMATRLGIELAETEEDLYLMGRNMPSIPQMYLTDQF